jgi:hypothetical protein
MRFGVQCLKLSAFAAQTLAKEGLIDLGELELHSQFSEPVIVPENLTVLFMQGPWTMTRLTSSL